MVRNTASGMRNVVVSWWLAVALTTTIVSGCTREQAPRIFPTAVRVRVLATPAAQDEIEVDAAGRATNMDARPRSPSKVIDGGNLSANEIKRLRAAIHFVPPMDPNDAVACCQPRHAFLFYDKDGRYLGHLLVCFECGCSDLDPYPTVDRRRNWMTWDDKAIAKIAIAHHLTPLAPFGQWAAKDHHSG